MKEKELQERYNQLFPDANSKATAFDTISRNYFFGNFGTLQKTDLETLIFSLYLDRILELSEEDIWSYSDHILSKYLGITQSKVSNLKIKKELKYPSPHFDWRKSFTRILTNARYENGKIKVFIPDRNLYLEIKNAIETSGGFVDVQLNSTLLQVTPEYFIDLALAVSNTENRQEIRENLKKSLQKNNIDIEFFEKKPIGTILQEQATNVGTTVIADIISSCIPVIGPLIGSLIKKSHTIFK